MKSKMARRTLRIAVCLGVGILAWAFAWAQAPARKAAPAPAKKAAPAARPGITRAPQAEIDQHIDRKWAKENMLDLLTHWRDASVQPNGFIQENLDRQWKPWGTQREASLNGQGRQLYSMVEGYEYSQDKRFLDAVTKAADFLLKMRDPKYGGYFNRTTPDWKVIDDTKTSYVSFTVFSLANAYRVTKDPKYLKAAMESYHEITSKMRDGQFFQNGMKRDFSGPAVSPLGGRESGAGGRGAAVGNTGGRGGQAPGGHRISVHLFEAWLALYDASHSKEVWDEISAEMKAFEKLYDYNQGYLPESYDADWKPTTNQTGGAGRMNTGHLFEWATLFSRAVELGADPKFIQMGSRSIDLGLKNGYNDAVGGLGGMDAQGKPTQMLWWPQCEVIKATARYATLHGRSDLWKYYDKTLAFVKNNYLDKEYGGWFEAVIPGAPMSSRGDRAFIKGAVDGPEWGSYHQTTLLTDLLYLSEPRNTGANHDPAAREIVMKADALLNTK
jgi:cellobiose epimerase